MLAAVLLLALDQEADPAGERADRREVGLDRPDPGQELALVVGRAPGVEATVAHGRLVRRRRPQLERDRRLDVVVLDRVQRPGSRADLADHQRRDVGPIGQLDHVDRRAQPSQPRGDPGGRVAEPLPIALLRAEPAELDELLGPASASAHRCSGRGRRSRSSLSPHRRRSVGRGYRLDAGRGAPDQARLRGRSRKGSSHDRRADPTAAAPRRSTRPRPATRSARGWAGPRPGRSAS